MYFTVSPTVLKQEMCIKAVEKDQWQLKDVPDHFKTQEMCDKVVRDYLFSLQFVPDWFVTYGQLNLWYDDDYVYSYHEMIEWYNAYKKRKAQKAKMKEELLPISWYPDCVMDWCLSGDGKRWWK